VCLCAREKESKKIIMTDLKVSEINGGETDGERERTDRVKEGREEREEGRNKVVLQKQ
jgi:hypothetical protein